MKHVLALGAFALLVALPLVSGAATLTSIFADSSTGTALVNLEDTVTFDVFLTLSAGVTYDSFAFSLTGDAVEAAGSSAGSQWAGVAHTVSDWSWNFSPGFSIVDWSGLGGFALPLFNPNPLGSPVLTGNGWSSGNVTGLGNQALIGTVEVTVGNVGWGDGGLFVGGVWVAGGFMHNQPIFDALSIAGGGTEVVNVTGGEFFIVPEPGTAMLVMLGLGGLGLVGRRSRSE